MMLSPNTYAEEHENDSFEELIEERSRLIEEMNELEKIAYDVERKDPAWGMHPGPDVQYQMTLEYLSQICDLLKEKYRRVIVWKEES